MRVLVIHEHIPEDIMSGLVVRDLRFIMVAKTDTMSMVSPVMTFIERGYDCAVGLYCVFGDACAEFTGLDQCDLNIEVAGIHSGDLEGWL